MPISSSSADSARQRLYEHFPDLREASDLLETGVQVLDYARGEVLFARGAPVERLFWLLQGEVQEESLRRLPNGLLQSQLERIVKPTGLRPLPVLGLYDYLYGQRHSTNAVVETVAQLLVIDPPTFEKLLYLRPDLPRALAPLAIYQRLRTIPLFDGVDRIALHYIAEAIEPQQVAAQTQLFAGGSPDLYLIDRGQVAVTQDDGRRVLLGNSAAFGLPGVDQAATALATGDLYRIPYGVLAALAPLDFGAQGQALRRQVQSTLGQLALFADPAFTPEIVAQLAGYVSHYRLPSNTVLAQQGELGDSLWVLLPGQRARIHGLDERGQALMTTSAVGPLYFGEAALLAQAPVEATLEAEAGGQWLRLHRNDFQLFLRTHRYRLLDKLKLRGEVRLLIGDEEAGERYPWLQDGEGILWLSHRHWLVLIRKSWLGLLLMVLAWPISLGLAVVPPLQLLAGIGLVGLGTLAAALLLWGAYDYWNDYIVVTNRRLVRQEKVLLQSVKLQETALDKIQNVDIAKSLAGNLLGYGLLRVHTAATQGAIPFDFVPEVGRVQRVLIGQMNRRQAQRAAVSKVEIQRQLENRLGLQLAMPERVLKSTPDPGPPPPSRRPRWSLLRRLRRRRRLPRYQPDHIVWRKHWLVLAVRLFWPVLLLDVLILLLLGELLFLPPPFSTLVTGPLSLVSALLALALLAWIAWQVADWYNDTYEVTRNEVADVEKLPLFFDEQRRTARLVDIDNIFSEVPSTVHYLFNYGNVRLETAATQGKFTFDSVPDPNGVAAEIRRRIEEARQRVEQERAQQRARELTDWFELYNRLGGNNK